MESSIKLGIIMSQKFRDAKYHTECLDVRITGVDANVVRYLCCCSSEWMFWKACDMFGDHQVMQVVKEMMRLVKKYNFPGPIGYILTVFGDDPGTPDACIIRAFTYNELGNMDPLVKEFDEFIDKMMQTANA